MAKQTYTAGQVLTASQMSTLQANDYNQTVSTKTANYTLVAADVGTRIVMNSATDATITVNTSLFAAGDTLWIHDIGAGSCTIVAGTCAVTTSSSLVIPTNGGGYLYFTSASTAIFFATGNIDTTLALSNRNVIINGAMQVAQRGTSVASITTGGYYTADRWRQTVPASSGTWTSSVENDAPTGSGFRNSLKMLCTTAVASLSAASRCEIDQYIEGQNVQQFLKGTSSAKSFAVSFWVKANVTGTYVVELFDYDNTRQVSASYTISASATWEKKTITFPADTTGAFTNDNGQSLGLHFYLLLGSDFTSGTLQTTWASSVNANRGVGQTNLASAINNYWQITGVQLEAGAVATPFEFEDYGTTLAKCQRYYQRTTGLRNFGLVTSQVAADAYGFIPLPCSMRVPPTSVDSNTLRAFDLVNAATTISSVTLDGSVSSESYAAIKIVTTGMTAFRTYYIIQNGATSYLGFGAEL